MTKIIVACDKCKHQYGIHEKRVGEKFHCFCGNLLTIPSVKIHDAAVVRCSSCGGSRGKDQEPFCRYCGSSFTLHERDLNTICPHCMTRISSKSKFCHSCATPIVADYSGFEATDMACPSCDDSKLHSREMASNNTFTVKECDHCAGLWISAGVFRHLEQTAQKEAASGVQAGVTESREHNSTENINPKKYYRKCPHCQKLMHRRNYAQSSGVVIDVCTQHGIWFDIHELDEVLDFIRSGELLKQQEKSARQAKLAMKRSKPAPPQQSNVASNLYQSSHRGDIFSDIIDWLVD